MVYNYFYLRDFFSLTNSLFKDALLFLYCSVGTLPTKKLASKVFNLFKSPLAFVNELVFLIINSVNIFININKFRFKDVFKESSLNNYNKNMEK